MEFRLIAALLAAFSGAFYGLNRSENLKKRMNICSEADKVFRLFEIMIRNNGTDIYSIISILKRDNYTALSFINKLPDEYSAESDIHAQWSELLNTDKDIPQEEKGILLDFGQLLGASDIDGQLCGIAVQKSLMQQCYQRRSEEYHTKAKLYRSVGVLAGVMAGIMVI
ncbi:MAG: stage III sporulation protein AB [Oscillospiraceae bacterium]|nr:stage III sporulation protein AB [Oscillospiraceae bacterium]